MRETTSNGPDDLDGTAAPAKKGKLKSVGTYESTAMIQPRPLAHGPNYNERARRNLNARVFRLPLRTLPSRFEGRRGFGPTTMDDRVAYCPLDVYVK